MATAEELLAKETGAVLSINLETRTIDIPANVKNIGVESDDDVLVLPFSIPRYFGETDLGEFEIRINYLNAKKEGDSYLVTGTEIHDDVISFEWRVGRYATAYKGNVIFNVCLKKITEDGIVTQEFNTTVCSLPVLEGLETDEQVIQKYPDIFNNLVKSVLDSRRLTSTNDGNGNVTFSVKYDEI